MQSIVDLLRIYCGPVDSCGPIVYRCFFADLLRICCGSTAGSLFIGVSLRICCGSTAGSLFIGVSLRIYCGSTAGPLFIGVSLRIYCRSTAGPLHLAGPLFKGGSLRIYCGPLFLGDYRWRGWEKVWGYKLFWMGCRKGIHGTLLLVASGWIKRMMIVKLCVQVRDWWQTGGEWLWVKPCWTWYLCMPCRLEG